MCQKKFTKSAFKIALECPRRLYYAYDSKLYANQDLTDEFLKSLADGGFGNGIANHDVGTHTHCGRNDRC